MSQRDNLSLLRDSANSSSNQESRNYESLENNPETHNQNTSHCDPKKSPQYIAALTATLSALAAGVVLGWTSPILTEIQMGHFNNITVNSDQMGWIGSFATLGAMVMCIPTGYICDVLGTKLTLISLAVPFVGGWTLIIIAQSVLMLYFGRLVTGAAVGACCVAAPLYIGEIAEKEIRGTLGSYFQLMITIGIFLAYFLGTFLGNPITFTIFCSVFPLIFVALFVFQPESPRYYLKRGKYPQASESLKKLRGDCPTNEGELQEIESSLRENHQTSISLRQTLKKKHNLKALLVAFALMFFQQFSGINAIILYTSDIFKAAGVDLNPNIAAIIVGAVQAISTFISSLIIDKVGRRPLLLQSATIMSLSSCVLAVFFSLKFHTTLNLSGFGAIPIGALCLFVVVFSIGLGPIPWMISSELFQPEIRSLCSSVAGTFNWFFAFLVTKFYLQVAELGQDVTYYGFSLICLLGAVFVYFVVPETKGKSVEEIQVELDNW